MKTATATSNTKRIKSQISQAPATNDGLMESELLTSANQKRPPRTSARKTAKTVKVPLAVAPITISWRSWPLGSSLSQARHILPEGDQTQCPGDMSRRHRQRLAAERGRA